MILTTYLRVKGHTNKAISLKKKRALEALSKDDNLVFKKADKGGAVAVWGKEMYVKEAFRQVNNSEFYQALSYNPTESLKQELGKIVSEAKGMGWITEHELRFLWNQNP